MRNSRPTLVLAIVMALFSAGCGASEKTEELGSAYTLATETGEEQTVDLEDQLLTIDDLPAGWVVDNSESDDGGGAPECLDDRKQESKPIAKAEASFSGDSGFKEFAHQLAAYAAGDGEEAFEEFTRRLSGCGEFSMRIEGETIDARIGEKSFEPVAGVDQQKAYQTRLDVQGLEVLIDQVIVRKSDVIMVILYADMGWIDSDEVRTLVEGGVSKLGS